MKHSDIEFSDKCGDGMVEEENGDYKCAICGSDTYTESSRGISVRDSGGGAVYCSETDTELLVW